MSSDNKNNQPKRVPPEWLRAGIEKLRRAGASVDDILKAITSSLLITEDRIRGMAESIFYLEEVGYDTNQIGHPLVPSLRAVAFGQLLPGCVVSLIGCSDTLRRVRSLPIPEQEVVASGKEIPVYFLSRDGVGCVQVEPSRMRSDQVKQVFAPDHIRNEKEQIAYLRGLESKSPANRMVVTAKNRTVALDKKNRSIRISPAKEAIELTVVELLEYVKQLS